MNFIFFILIGLAAGWLAGQIIKGRGLGLFGNLAVGVVGSFLGGFLFRLIGLSAHGIIGSLVMATAGAVALLLIVKAIKKV